MAKVLIAGCGDLGSGVAAELVKNGHEVTGIRRTKAQFPEGVVGMTGDLLSMTDDNLPNVDVVFLIMTPNGRDEDAYRAAYFDTAQVLIRRYKAMVKPPQVFFVSSTSVYGQHQGEWVDETTPAIPSSATATVLLETEQALAAVLPSVTVRCSGIYGPGRFRLLETVLSEKDWEANSWTNRIHRDDVVSALVTLANIAFEGKDLPKQVIVTDQTPVSMWEVKLWLATCLGARVAVKESNQFVPASGKRIQGQYLLSQGWVPRYPSYVAGYHALLREFNATR
ncbi:MULTISPECIES: NAD-dependent epimerase/dehydratase family protein [Marinomonas]|uniref:NAD-dependent epimerase/dehydratase family protein n=1 Tax=Marinomonas arctica TaxID=383750 RepID=A0A7H1J685_9GAMM|nr:MULTISPECIES: NAD-dependent epimerase/dehydratase family protein [Marinomonas]MCS7484987.1 epimerase [Marinomonas sp. BSi20414]QNT06001.1 NAD-dependent epimerase/dehydratase family protein [Marinomonas arctica]GGN19631.1 NAD(P)-dependent oxidoreductase [Marinomonas arctica]